MNVTALSALLNPVLAGHGLELDALVVVPAGKRSLLRVTVDGDGPHGRGPTLDEIAVATRAVSEALDASPLTGNSPYVLEVSSRGVGTPLTRDAHYRRNRGRLVALTTTAGVVVGRLVDTGPSEVTLEIEGARRTVALADVSRAVVQVELNRKPDPTLDDGDEIDGLDEDEDDEFGDDADQDDDATEPRDAAEEN